MNIDKKKKYKKFKCFFIAWIIILAIGIVRKEFQNDTFYTIKIGELIFKNGIDMLDHFSIHVGLSYTYPHWLYDCFIYLIYSWFGFTGIYISSILLFIILLLVVFKTNIKIANNYMVAAFATFICALAISGFVTARAQLVSFILFAIQIYFIESFINNGKKRYLIGLWIISLILCNIHVAVWPFYFILYLPYLGEYLVAVICNKIKLKKENKFINYLKKKMIITKSENIKYLFITMLASLLTGLITPLGDTPYTYLIKTMLGNSQKYIQEHQKMSWADSPFTLIIAFETFFLAFFSKIKLRDLFMISGLVLMNIFSIRHMALLALVGTICFSRVFSMFLSNFDFDVDSKVYSFVKRKWFAISMFILVILFSSFMLVWQSKHEFVNHELYPTEAVKFIKKNIDVKNMRLFNEYNYGSYLIFSDIPVFIDSRADLYTKQFSGFDYDIFDDFEFIVGDYQKKFQFYGITHVLLYKVENALYTNLMHNSNYRVLYTDDYFILFEKTGDDNIIVTYKY